MSESAKAMKTSLGIWAFGPMVTRFVPIGYKPNNANETTSQKVERAVRGLGELIDGYEFHYPQELSRENLEEVRGALDGRDIYCIASGLTWTQCSDGEGSRRLTTRCGRSRSSGLSKQLSSPVR
jgi:hypothetical protein